MEPREFVEINKSELTRLLIYVIYHQREKSGIVDIIKFLVPKSIIIHSDDPGGKIRMGRIHKKLLKIYVFKPGEHGARITCIYSKFRTDIYTYSNIDKFSIERSVYNPEGKYGIWIYYPDRIE